MLNSPELQPAATAAGPAKCMEFAEYAALRAGRLHAYRPVLAVDATGVGAPVIDLFKAERMNAQLEAVQITGGDSVTREYGMSRVPKRDLVSAAQVALQTSRLRVSPELPEVKNLTRELENFQVRINLDTAHDSYGAWRENAHDDLVLAVCIALWIADNGVDKRVYIF